MRLRAASQARIPHGPPTPGSPHSPRPAQPRVAVILIGANDMTNSGWSLTDQKKKEGALAKEVPGIVGR